MARTAHLPTQLLLALGLMVATTTSAWAGSSVAVDVAAGLAIGESYVKVTPYKGSGGGGPLFELGARYAKDNLVLGARTGATPALFGAGARELLAELGGQGEANGGRPMLLLTGGVHTIREVGAGLFTTSYAPSVSLPCFGLRARMQSHGQRITELGLNVFFLRDLGHREVTATTSGVVGSRSTETYKVGGWNVGLAVDTSFGDRGR